MQFNNYHGVGMDTRGRYVFRSCLGALPLFPAPGYWVNMKSLSFHTGFYPAIRCGLCFKSVYRYSGNRVLDIVCVHIQRYLLMS